MTIILLFGMLKVAMPSVVAQLEMKLPCVFVGLTAAMIAL